MENRAVGFLIVGIAALIGFIIFSFNTAMIEIVTSSCSHGISCPMWGTITFQTNVSMSIMAFVIVVGVYLILFGKEKKEIETKKPKKITKRSYSKIMSDMNSDEKNIFEKIIEEEGTIFQSELVEKTKFSKAKVSRVLDKLEGKGLVERRRRGMTNVIILKH